MISCLKKTDQHVNTSSLLRPGPLYSPDNILTRSQAGWDFYGVNAVVGNESVACPNTRAALPGLRNLEPHSPIRQLNIRICHALIKVLLTKFRVTTK
jgi:hypothetical protein